jgi:nicotinic acid phosphoribosyltransferase
MGLDSYCYSVNLKDVIDDFHIAENCQKQEVMYWRKHHELHKWATRLFVRKGGDLKNGFNCEYIRITLEDLDFLEKDMDWLDEHPFDEWDYDDFKFIREAREILLEGKKGLYFYSWY